LFDRGYKDFAPTELFGDIAKTSELQSVAPTELIRGITKRPFPTITSMTPLVMSPAGIEPTFKV
jgi:hypothetical protein